LIPDIEPTRFPVQLMTNGAYAAMTGAGVLQRSAK
jgi:hypothetical protein